jgi:hypothetical protein
MVHLPDFRLMQTALLTAPRRRVHGPGSGLNTGDKKTHLLSPGNRFCTGTYRKLKDNELSFP